MSNVRISIEGLKEVRDLIKKLPKEYPKVMRRAVNKGLDSARTETWRGVKGHYTVKQKAFYDQIKREKSKGANLSGKLFGTNKPIRTANFKTTPRKSGVRIELERGDGSIHPYAFPGKMRVGEKQGVNKGVFIRATGLGKGKGKKLPKGAYAKLPRKYRLPIWQLLGFSAAQMIDDGTPTLKNSQEKGLESMGKEFTRQMDRVLKGK